MPNYIPSVGMEVHAELDTHSKMFCRCKVAFGGEPNTRVCPICLGMPGTLPVPNRAAIQMVLKTSLALNCKIAMHSVFHRKNYFYPDLPKGYQVSQYGETNPIGYHGWLEIPAKNGGTKRIHIRRVHLEEDTGKLMHLPTGGSGIDYNRAGVPLMEIVTGFNPETGKPDISDPDEAKEYLSQLRQILLYLGVCNGKMEEGSLRCEPNISVRKETSDHLGVKTELKNLNSFRSVQLGVDYEVARQIQELEQGGQIYQETRGWNEEKNQSFVMRIKETEQDYRYFPDPDLLPLCFDHDEVEEVRRALPELPLAKQLRYERDMGLTTKEAAEIVDDLEWADYFEEGVKLGADPKQFFNFMRSELAMRLNSDGLSSRQSKVTPGHIVDLLNVLNRKTINSKQAKEIFATMYGDGRMPTQIVAESGASQISDGESVRPLVKEVLKTYPDVVSKYKSGQVGVKGYLVGQVMRLSKGRANPELVQELVAEELDGVG
jgi:aspartyl-tRNA(Asn)/glutamyl-tRNA(Gln) amidotransferase subunit B